MKYEMKSSNNGVAKRAWDDVQCHPSKDIMESMYEAGQRLYVDGVKQTKAQAIALMPRHPYAETTK